MAQVLTWAGYFKGYEKSNPNFEAPNREIRITINAIQIPFSASFISYIFRETEVLSQMV